MDHQLMNALREGDINQVKEFASRNGNLFPSTSPQGNTALHMAARFGQESLVQQILNIQPSLLYETNLKGETPLHIAARASKAAVVKIFIAANSGSNRGDLTVESGRENILRKKDKEGNAPLHCAIKKDHQDMVRMLVEEDKEPVILVNAAGDSPLSIAIDARLSSTARFIIRINPSALDHKGPDEQTLLHSAVQREDYDVVLDILKAKPELVNTIDRRKRIPVHYAVASGHGRIVESLLKIDVSLAYQGDCDGQTHIHLATENDQILALKMLLQYCPDAIELVDNRCRNILHLAAKNGDKKMVVYILNLPEMEDLINSLDEDGNTPLHLAAMYPLRSTVTRILSRKKKMNIWSTNKNQETALDLAKSSHPENAIRQHFTLTALKEAHAKRVNCWLIGFN